MRFSDLPVYKFPDAWAIDAPGGNITFPIPDTTGTPGRASLKQGWTSVNFTSTGAGGVPPFGQDFNGAMQMMTLWLQWAQAGGFVPYDSTFQSAIGGYPKGAVVQDPANPLVFWVSFVDNNTASLVSGSNWFPISILPSYGIDSGTANAIVVATTPAGVLPYGQPIYIQKAGSANTGACTAQLLAFAAKPLTNADGSALSNGQLPAGGWFAIMITSLSGGVPTAYQLLKGSA